MDNKEIQFYENATRNLHLKINKITSAYFKKNNSKFEGRSITYVICAALSSDLGKFIPIAYKDKDSCEELRKAMIEIIDNKIDCYFSNHINKTDVKI